MVQEGAALLGDDDRGKTRGQTQQEQEQEAVKTPEKPKLPRDSTMVVTAKVSGLKSFIKLVPLWVLFE